MLIHSNFYSLEYKVKKEGWGSGGTREIHFIQMEYRNKEILKTSGKILNVWIGPGLPCTTSKLTEVIVNR